MMQADAPDSPSILPTLLKFVLGLTVVTLFIAAKWVMPALINQRKRDVRVVEPPEVEIRGTDDRGR